MVSIEDWKNTIKDIKFSLKENYEKEKKLKLLLKRAKLGLEEKKIINSNSQRKYSEGGKMKAKYFITVQKLGQGTRGIFCDRQGKGFFKESKHSLVDFNKVLGAFVFLFNPKSQTLTEEQMKKMSRWTPLAEFKYEYGIAFEQGKR